MVFRLGSNKILFDTFLGVPPLQFAVANICTNTPRVIADSKCGAFFEFFGFRLPLMHRERRRTPHFDQTFVTSERGEYSPLSEVTNVWSKCGVLRRSRCISGSRKPKNSKNAPHLESAITLGVFVQMFATANCSGGTPKKVSNNILLDPSRKTIFRSTGEIGVSDELH